MTNTKTPIGQALRGIRRAAGLTLADVAKVADTAVAYLSKVESGTFTPSADYAARITSAIASEMRRTASDRRAA